WSWRHWNGSRGSTTNACSNPSATFRPLRPKRDTIGNLQRRLWNLFYFNQTASAIPGVIQHRAIHLVQELLTACLLALTGKFRFRKTQLAHDEQTREGVTDEVYRWAGELFRASLSVCALLAFPED